MPNLDAELAAISAQMTKRREQVLRAWAQAVKADPRMASAAALPRKQLHDHIPALLTDFERALAAGGKAHEAAQADQPQRDAAAHGVTRWQQGFDLAEVAREFGRLNECVGAELEAIATASSPPSPQAMAAARACWARLYNTAVSGSVEQYDALRQAEAVDQIDDLEAALKTLGQLEQQRADLWEQAAHDLRGNLGVVANATAGLSAAHANAALRDSFLGLLGRNVAALHQVLDDVASLARLQGGQERRQLAAMDAAALLRSVSAALQAQAQQRGLALTAAGPDALPVEGDAAMMQRIVHNLVADAIHHTRSGSVSVAWGTDAARDGERWYIEVRDTGPRQPAVDASLIVHTLPPPGKELRPMPAAAAAEPADASEMPRPTRIGLAIAKRLCELLDAALEVDSTDDGTSFRIALPLRYAA